MRPMNRPAYGPGGRSVHLLGMPQDYGQTLRGVDMGPSALRVAGLEERLERLGVDVIDRGDVDCPVMATQDEGESKLRFLPAVVEGSNHLARDVRAIVEAGGFPLILGGDHSISIGTLAGLGQVERRQGLIWVDAHGDFNTPDTTPSGNIHGMALAIALGYGDPRLTSIGGDFPKALEGNTVLVGVRDLDRAERDLLKTTRVTVFTMRDIDEQGMRAIMEKAIAVASRDVSRVHLSFDMDFMTPDEAPGVGTPVPGGATFREAHLALEMLADAGILTSMEFVEVNPTLDDRNQTSQLAVGLVASALGQRIY
jgi:arginase